MVQGDYRYQRNRNWHLCPKRKEYQALDITQIGHFSIPIPVYGEQKKIAAKQHQRKTNSVQRNILNLARPYKKIVHDVEDSAPFQVTVTDMKY